MLCRNAPFTLLPILIGFRAAKRFGGNPLGAALGIDVLVHPSLIRHTICQKQVKADHLLYHIGMFLIAY